MWCIVEFFTLPTRLSTSGDRYPIVVVGDHLKKARANNVDRVNSCRTPDTVYQYKFFWSTKKYNPGFVIFGPSEQVGLNRCCQRHCSRR
ncbi:hypothetical protein Plhal304r1_c020g0071761 [Plasmopara halstedii]